MKLFFSFLVAFLISIFAVAQKEIRGIIVNSEGERIPFCRIKNISKQTTALSDSLGAFEIIASEKDSLEIKNLGFETLLLKGWELGGQENIILKSKPITLPEIVIKPTKKIEIVNESNASKQKFMIFDLESDFEYGTLINDFANKSGKITSIKILTGFEGSPIIPFRIRIYRIDNQNSPTLDLLDKNIITYPSQKPKWITIDIKENPIYINNEKIAIIIEWLLSGNKNPSKEKSKKFGPKIGVCYNQNSVSYFNKKGNTWSSKNIITLKAYPSLLYKIEYEN